MSSLFLEILGGEGDSPPPAELPRQGRLVIGSSVERASLVVTGQGVADVHCTIGRIKGGGWALRDLGSQFGTIVNGERVDTARLAAGDEILLGSRKLRVFDPAATREPSPARETPARGTQAKATPPKPAPAAAAQNPPVPARATRAKGGSNGAMPTISGYLADRMLGHGGMGDVFLATQESLQRRVALKILKSKLANDDTFVERFRQEARAAARLNHPNIVTVYDVGEDGGKHFLSMEFMAGGSIEARLTELGPLPWREALDVIRDAAAGLVYAESRGIVHRDIKPENLMRNQDGVTKIADLGLAVQVEQEIVDGSSGKVFGTPHFIAPEVIRGQPSDARSDLYSLGVTAYRILSGHTPFEGPTSRDILRAALGDDPAPLGARVPGLPPAFEAVIHRLLEKDPEKRPPSASVLLTELERMRQGDTSLPGASTASSSRSVAMAIVGVLIAAVAAFAIFGGGDPNGPDDTPGGFRGTTDPAHGDSGPPQAVPHDPEAGDGEPDGVDPNQAGPGESAPGATGEVAPTASGTDSPPVEGPVEGAAEIEFTAQLAYQQLGDEQLTPADRAARLRALAIKFAGTDTAMGALTEAEQLETGTVAAGVVQAQRDSAIAALLTSLRAAADLAKTPFHPGQALRAMRLVEGQELFADDPGFVAERAALVDEVLKLGLARGLAAVLAADAAEATGDFAGTQTALRGFIAVTDLPTAEEAPLLVGTTAPPSLAEFQALGAAARTRLELLSGREAEFENERVGREWRAMAEQLGGSLELDLRAFDLSAASTRIRAAAAMVSDGALRADLIASADDLELAAAALEAVITGWTTPGWRRRGVVDPRPGHSGKIDVVNATQGAVMVAGNGSPVSVPISAWCGRTKALENLFRGRLTRDWTPTEERGVLVLLTVSATIESFREFDPALQSKPKRLTSSAAQAALRPFEEALDWAKRDPELEQLARAQRAAVEALGAALVARDSGNWGLSAELLGRLLDERRTTWIVMLLSDGGRR